MPGWVFNRHTWPGCCPGADQDVPARPWDDSRVAGADRASRAEERLMRSSSLQRSPVASCVADFFGREATGEDDLYRQVENFDVQGFGGIAQHFKCLS